MMELNRPTGGMSSSAGPGKGEFSVPEPTSYSLPEISRALGVPYLYVWQAVAAGRLPAVRGGDRPGSRYRVPCALAEPARVLGVEPPAAEPAKRAGRHAA